MNHRQRSVSGMTRHNVLQRSRFHLLFIVFTFLSAVLILLQSRLLVGLHTTEEPSNKPLRKDATDTTDRAIFYNIFIPDGENRQNALDIVIQQLARKTTSRLIGLAPIYFTVIGNNATDDIQKLCGPQCHLLRYAQEGDEGLTLESLFDYCTEHPDSLVTYLHDKGSFHPSDRNDRLRIMLTKAVFSDACQTISADQCNICSARFSPLPHFHMAGNMWTAHCSYVRKLIHPRTFADKMDDLMDHVLSKNDTTIPKPTPFQIRQQYMVGLKRYALEHWLGSHPWLQPCDVYPNARYLIAYSNLPKPFEKWTPKLQQAPWLPFQKFKGMFGKGDWFCGPARLLEFEFLYGLRPQPNSFLWSYYAEELRDCPIPLNLSDHLKLV
jgi:hypothetical protein